MAKSRPIIPSRNKSHNDDKIDKNFGFNWNYFNNLWRNIPLEYLKLVSIIVLLIASVGMFSYKPKPIIRHVNRTEVANNQTRITQIDDNPYGFHPFYQVHRRIQYKNPAINTCRGINGRRTILLALLSRASNAHIREAIRHSWGGVRVINDMEIRTTFVVGVDDGMLKQIEIEQSIYHDVIQVNLPENYPVVSYKELAAICWSKYFCPEVEFVFKADEDIHLNTPLLVRLVSEYMKNETITETPVMFGWFRHKSRVDRVGRYLITEEEYPGFYYPPYTFGIGYLVTKAARHNLCLAAQRPHPVTRVGDAYITGILRDHALVDYASFGDVHYIYSYTLSGPRCKEYLVYDPKLLVCMSSIHSGASEASDEYVHVWNTVHKDVDEDEEQDDEE